MPIDLFLVIALVSAVINVTVGIVAFVCVTVLLVCVVWFGERGKNGETVK